MKTLLIKALVTLVLSLCFSKPAIINAQTTTNTVPAQIQGSQYIYHAHRELPDAILNKSYTRKILVTKLATDTFTLLAGQSLPNGLTLNATTGFVSGVPTVAGPFKFGVQVGTLTYMVHLMVLPVNGETLTPTYYDEKGLYEVNQESIVINFATNELIDGKETKINALISYPANSSNLNQVAAGKFPVISLMHGSGYQGIYYTQMLKILSSHGFIVIAPTTLTWGHNYSIWRDWQIIQRRGYEIILNMDLDSTSKYFGHANRDAIGLVGHSWGGATTELNMFRSAARAFVFIDDISLYDNVADWNKLFNCFSQPDPFPSNPIMILKGGPSRYNSSIVEFEGAFTGPRYLATFNTAQHENFLNPDFGGWPTDQILVEDYTLSRFTNRNTAHHLASFFKRYLLDEVTAGANLYSPFALTQSNDISPFGGSMVAVRPDWAGQLMIDDFSSGSLLTNNLGFAVSSTLNATNGKPLILEDLNKANNSYNFPANDLVVRPQYCHLLINQSSGSASGTFTENLGTNSLPLDASFYSHIAFEIAQKRSTLSATLPLSVKLVDALGATAEIPISNSVPTGGFQSILPHSILLPLSSFSGLNISKLVSMTFVLNTPSQNLSIEIDNIRLERLPSIVNLPPTAKDQSVTTSANIAKSIVLVATDKNNNSLTYSISSQPTNGTVSLVGNTATYTPNNNFEGYDQFNFKASDGSLISNSGVVNITVIGSSTKPTANNQTVSGNDLNPINIVLTGSDANAQPLTYTLLSIPTRGNLTGTVPNLTYRAYQSASGALTDTFTFKVNSGKLDSNIATVTIQLSPVNHPPYAYNVSTSTVTNRSRNIILNGGDYDNEAITYSYATPLHGTLSGLAPNLIYTPATNYAGSDSFTYTTYDGKATSTTATVSITVNSANSVPTISNLTINATSGYPLTFESFYSDWDRDPLTFSVVSNATFGTTSAPFKTTSYYGISYLPNSNFVGTDTIKVKVNDGFVDSAIATISINVALPQVSPVSATQTLSAVGGVPLAINLSATDPNSDPIYYELTTQPIHGVLSGTPPNLVYTANSNYSGPDGFIFNASDGRIKSNAKISINNVAAPDTIAPTIPSGLSASNITQTSFALSWNASTDAVGVTGYKVFRGGVQIGTSATTSFVVSGLTAAMTYSFTVSAYDAAGNNSALSSALTVTTLAIPDTTAPTIPSGLKASSVTQTTLTLSWSASSDNVGVTGYKVFRGGSLVGTTINTNLSISGLTAATSYLFTVSAYDAAGNNSAVSNGLSITTLAVPDTTAPSIPSGLVASSITQTSFALSWTASSDAVGVTGYKIFKGGIQIGTATATSFAVSGLTAATTYSLTVSAYDAAGNNSAVSNALSVTTLTVPDTTAPSIPSGLVASSITQTSFTLSWTASSDAVGAIGYKIFKGGIQIGTATATSFAVSGLTAATSYSFTVSAYDAAGNNSAVSNALSVTTLTIPDTIAPTAPYINSAYGISHNSMTVAWVASTDAVGVTGYKIFVSGNQIGTSTTTSFLMTGLTPTTTYLITVSAFDAAGNNSPLSNVFSSTTMAAPDTTPPSVPTNLVASAITQTSVNLSWTASTDNFGVSGYKIYKGGVYIASTSSTNYSVTGLTALTSYSFTVSAYDAAVNNSAASSPLTVTTLANPDTTAPSIPTNLMAASVTQTSLTLSWTASTDAIGVTGYKIFKGGVQIGTATTTSFAVSGLTAATTYSLTVSAYDAAGNNSAMSSALSVTTLAMPDTTAPTVPSGLVASSVTQTTFTLSWTASTDAVGVTGYKIFKGGVQIGSATTTSFAVSGLTAATTYSLTVSAFDAAGNNSAVSSAFTVITLGNPDTIAPSTPSISSGFGISSSTISISWMASTDNVGVTGYKVYMNGNLMGTSTVTNFAFSGLTSSTTYAFTVSAFDAAGNQSALSPVANFKTTPQTYKLAVTYGPNGKITPSGYFSAYIGDSIKFTVTPDAGYQVEMVTINGVNIGALTNFTFTNSQPANQTIYASFKVSANTIATYSNVNASLKTTSGAELNYGNSQTFNLTPSSGYQIEKTLVDGVNYKDFNQSTFSTVEFILSKNTFSKMNRLNENTNSLLTLYKNENCSDNLNIKYEIALVGYPEVYSGEIDWTNGEENKKEIENPFAEDVQEDTLISVKLISVGKSADIDAENIDIASANNNPTNEIKSNVSGSSGGCSYVSSMSYNDQAGNILLMFGLTLLIAIRRIKRNLVSIK